MAPPRKKIKQPVVTTVAVLFCGAVVLSVGVFSFVQYKSARERNAAFQAQLIEDQNRQAAAGTPTPALPLRP
jgi:hypothetical protein